MSRLRNRVRRLEQGFKKKGAHAPTRAEFDDAAFRQRTRLAYSARLKLYRIAGREDEEELLRSFSPKDRAFLEADTEEQRARDEDVMRRYERANGSGAREETKEGVASRVRQKLRSIVRVTTGDNPLGRG